MSEKLEVKIENKISSIVEEIGFSIEYIEFVKESSNNVLRIVVDKNEGLIDIDDCEKISRLIEDSVDSLISKEYVLEVSSPGLERQLKNMKLYKKYVGKEIFVKLYKKSEYGKEFTCILEDASEKDNCIIVSLNGEKVKFLISDIANAYTTYDFSKLLSKKSKTNINELKKF